MDSFFKLKYCFLLRSELSKSYIYGIIIFILFTFSSCNSTHHVHNNNNNLPELPWVSVVEFKDSKDKDWSDAINLAIKEAGKSGKKKVYIPSGTYVINKQINLEKDIDLIGSSMTQTIIKSSIGGEFPDAIIRVSGGSAHKLNIKLTRKVNSFDRIIEVNSTKVIREGDVLLLCSRIKNSWSKGFSKGEYIKIQSKTEKTFKIFGQVYDDYDKGELDIYLFDGTQSSIENLTVIGDPTQVKACIRIESGLNNCISNLILSGSNYAGIVTILGYNQTFDGIRAEKASDDNGVGLSYGMNIGNSQNVIISNSNLYGVRHGLTFGGAGTIKVPNRFNLCVNSTLSSTTNYAASFHPNTEYCAYMNCSIFGGVLIRGKSNKIGNCTIFNLYNENITNNGNAIHFSPNVLNLNHTVTNNIINMKKGGKELAISYQDGPNNSIEGGNLVFSDNTIHVHQEGILESPEPIINFNFKNSDNFSTLSFNNNNIFSSGTNHIIQIRSFNNKNFNKVFLESNRLDKVNISLENISNCFIKNNTIENFGGIGLFIHQKYDSFSLQENIFIENNMIRNGEGIALYIIGSNNKSNQLIIKGNTLIENLNKINSRFNTSVIVKNIESLFIRNNIIGNSNNHLQSKKAILSNFDALFESGNVWLGFGKVQRQ